MGKGELKAFGIKALDSLDVQVDGVIVAVAHDAFRKMKLEDVKKFMNEKPVMIDVRSMFKAKENMFYYKRL